MVAVVSVPSVLTGVAAAAAAATLTRGAVVQPLAIVTPGLTLANPMAAVALPAFGPLLGTPGSEVFVNSGETFQPFYGVGAAMTNTSAYCLTHYMTSAAATAFLQEAYGTNGFSTLRVPMGSSDFTADAAFRSYDDNGGVADYSLTNFSIALDEITIIPLIQQVFEINPKTRMFFDPWSLPGWLKSNGALVGGSYVNTTQNNTTAANYIIAAVTGYAAYGIPTWAVTLQNEPNFSPAAYPGCTWAGTDMAAVHPVLGAARDTAGLSFRILAGNAAWGDTGTLVSAPYASAAALAYLDGAAYHAYDGLALVQEMNGRPFPSKSIHMTEYCIQFSYSAATALLQMVSVSLISAIQRGAQSITYWNVMTDQNGAPYLNNINGSGAFRGVVTINKSTGVITRNLEYYALSHLGRYLQNGALVCYSTTTALLQTIAFVNPDRSVLLFLLNADTVAHKVPITDDVTQQTTVLPMNPNDIASVFWAPGEAVTAGTFAAPTAPQNLKLTSSNGNLIWNWTAPASIGTTDLGGYLLNRGTASNGETLLIEVPAGTLSYTDTTGVVGTTYFGTVSAYGGGGVSQAPSNEASVQVVAGAPAAPVLGTPTVGNGTVSIPWTSGAAHGSAITSQEMMRSTTSGSEVAYMAVIGTSPFVDSSATNGTQYFYDMISTNGVGPSVVSNEVSATPSAAVQAPTHYLTNTATTGGAGCTPVAGQANTTGFIDLRFWGNLSTYTFSYDTTLIGSYASKGQVIAKATPSLYITAAGYLAAIWGDSSGTYHAFPSTALISTVTPSSTLGIAYRAAVNASAAAITGVDKVAYPAGTLTFYTSIDGELTWQQLGTQVTGVQTGFESPGASGSYPFFGIGNSNNVNAILLGKMYKAIAYRGDGTIIYNPDFTIQPSATTTFNDTAATPNAWSVYNSGVVA